MGFRENELISDHYRTSQLLFNPSRFEGGGLTTLEAMACGTPVITTPTGYGRDLMEKIPEFVVGFNDIDGFVNNHQKILENRENFSKKALEYFFEYHNPEKFEKSWINLIENI
jgi:glycosyltransferase involved in cell wall biosynthesis